MPVKSRKKTGLLPFFLARIALPLSRVARITKNLSDEAKDSVVKSVPADPLRNVITLMGEILVAWRK